MAKIRNHWRCGWFGPNVRGDAQFRLDEDDRSHFYELPIHVAQMTLWNQTLPSILGWDLLSAFKVCVDRLNATVTLEPHQI